jgi:hypothetical protein
MRPAKWPLRFPKVPSSPIRYALGIWTALILSLVPSPSSGQQILTPDQAALIKTAAEKLTPRTADGHPDLNGYWRWPEPSIADHQVDGITYVDALATRAGAARPAGGARAALTVPPYKLELLPKVKNLAAHEVDMDPGFHCKPLGIPRVSLGGRGDATPATFFSQTPNVIVMLYQVDDGAGDVPGLNPRIIPMDGRPHRKDVDPMYFGDSVGHWEGDTLVVDVTHLTDETWLGIAGYFHSDALHVAERYTRKGNTLIYEATIEDPEVLTKPWIVGPLTSIAVDDFPVEQPPCDEREAAHIVNGANHAGGSVDAPR